MWKAHLLEVYPFTSKEVSRQLSEDKETPPKRWWERVSELGPAWITAIAGLCAVFVGGGYVAGHASGSGESDPAPQPLVTETVTSTATPTSPVTGSSRSTQSSQAAASNGSVLGSYKVNLPSGFSIPLGASKPTQSQFDSSEQSGDLDDENFGYTGDYQVLGGDKIVQLPDGTMPTYQSCRDDTGFTGDVIGGLGVAFCVLENGKIAGVEVISQSSSPPDYILQVTVWRNIS